MKKITALLCAALMAALPAMAQTYSKDLEKKAKGGDAAAMVEVGDCYFKGAGVEKNAKKAKDWYEKAIKAGNIDAYPNIVACYSSWDGIEKDPKKAFKWIEKGAKAGNAAMQLALAKAYENGEGTPVNASAAANEYINAAYQGITEAAVPAIKGALATNNDLDAFTLAYVANTVDSCFTEEDKTLFNKAQGMVMLHADYEVAADHFFGDINDPEIAYEKLVTKLRSTGELDVKAWKDFAAAMPEDDASANLARGIAALYDEQWVPASKYLAKAAEKGNADARLALYILAQDMRLSKELARYEEMFNQSPVISFVLAKMANVNRRTSMELLGNAGLSTMKNLDFDSVKRRVEENNNTLGKPSLSLELETWNYVCGKYVEGMAQEGDPRGTLLKYAYMFGYSSFSHMVDNSDFYYDMLRVAAQGQPMAANFAGKVLSDYSMAMGSRPTPSSQAMYDSFKAKVENIRNSTPHKSISSSKEFIPICRQAIYTYTSTDDEKLKMRCNWQYAAWNYLVDEWLNPVPDKLNYIKDFNKPEDVKRIFLETAKTHPHFILQWCEDNRDEIVCQELSVPELLEAAAQHATGDTKTKINNILSSRYGR